MHGKRGWMLLRLSSRPTGCICSTRSLSSRHCSWRDCGVTSGSPGPRISIILSPEKNCAVLGVALSMIFVYVFAVFIGASFFAEQDATWHQTVVRDTSFTPSHIMLFYGSFPLFIILGIAAYLYTRTRLPRFAARHSLPFLIAVTGPFMLLPVVGYNEWAHSYWILEERFAAPVHAAFMLFAWTGLGLGGLLLQLCDYIYELTTGKAQSYEKGVPASDPALGFEQEDAVKVA